MSPKNDDKDLELLDEQIAEDDQESSTEIIDWDGAQMDGARALRLAGARYGKYSNEDRALPDIRDGFKPVHRRVLYSMIEDNLLFNRRFSKSVAAVGTCMKHYHPHGDSSIYEALVRLAQPFSMNSPLIEGQGNFGTRGPKDFSDPPAAMRYTEARLSELGSTLKEDLHKEIIAFVPNFSESTSEPTVLPVPFPNILVNGVTGIGWGMGVDIPPHNMGEAIDAAVLVAEKPDATLAQIMKRLPGPDFPTDGVIIAPEGGFGSIYETGKGTFRLEGKFHIENVKGGQALVITELPYGASARQIKGQVKAGAIAGKITEVTENALDRSNRKGIRVEVRLKRGGSMPKLVAQLRKYTALSVPIKCNFTVLIDGKPHIVGLKEILEAFVQFRRDVVVGRLEREKAGLLKELHRLTALRGALDVIDQVIKIIRTTKGDDDAVKAELKKIVKVLPYGSKKKVPIDDEQAEYIMAMQLRRLSGLNQFKLDEDIRVRTERVIEIDRLLSTPAEITAIVTAELKAAKKKFAVARRSHLADADAVADASEDGGSMGGPALPKTDVTVYVGAKGGAVAVETAAKRKDAPITLTGDDRLVSVLATDTDADLHVFTEQGQVYRIRAAELGIDSRKSKGKPVCALDRGDRVVALLPALDEARPFLTLVTAGGEIKRFDQLILARSHAGGMVCMDVPAGDRLVAVVAHADSDELILHSALGRALRTPMKPLRAVKSPSAGGVAGMKLAAGDEVVSAFIAGGDAVLVMHEHGHAKLVALAEYPAKGRGGGGVESVKTDKPTKEPAGKVVMAAAVKTSGEVTIASAKGQVMNVSTSDAPAGARGAVISRHWLEFGPGDHAAMLLDR